MGLLFSMWTVFVAIVFVGIVIWVLRTNKDEFDQAAQIPFEETDLPSTGENLKEDDDD